MEGDLDTDFFDSGTTKRLRANRRGDFLPTTHRVDRGGRACSQTAPGTVGGLMDLLHCLVQNPPPNRCNKSYRVQRMDTCFLQQRMGLWRLERQLTVFRTVQVESLTHVRDVPGLRTFFHARRGLRARHPLPL
jgi:hypothetical protein